MNALALVSLATSPHFVLYIPRSRAATNRNDCAVAGAPNSPSTGMRALPVLADADQIRCLERLDFAHIVTWDPGNPVHPRARFATEVVISEGYFFNTVEPLFGLF